MVRIRVGEISYPLRNGAKQDIGWMKKAAWGMPPKYTSN
jgi:hypothetical protein